MIHRAGVDVVIVETSQRMGACVLLSHGGTVPARLADHKIEGAETIAAIQEGRPAQTVGCTATTQLVVRCGAARAVCTTSKIVAAASMPNTRMERAFF